MAVPLPVLPFGSGVTIALGNFDGVHLGHRALLDHAQRFGRPVMAVTFEPHPRAFFDPAAPPFRLTSAGEKRQALIEGGADAVLALAFDAGLAAMSAEAFVRDILVGRLGARQVVIGSDYRFGRARQGDVAMLRQLGAALGFGVLALSAVTDGAGGRISSSLVRRLLADGRMDIAARMLGRPWSVASVGRRIADGRLEVPFGDRVRPGAGRYAVAIRWPDGTEIRTTATMEAGSDRLVVAGPHPEGPVIVSIEGDAGRLVPAVRCLSDAL